MRVYYSTSKLTFFTLYIITTITHTPCIWQKPKDRPDLIKQARPLDPSTSIGASRATQAIEQILQHRWQASPAAPTATTAPTVPSAPSLVGGSSVYPMASPVIESSRR